ncbi:hypothetical protein KO512_00970 [Amphritea atlantica]|nr:hypothetical protein [Amphritea atlantica]
MVSNLSSDSNMSFIVVQHRSHPS